MRKCLLLCLSLLLSFTLFGCTEKVEVKYYETKSYVKQFTGDITISENTYDENWNLLLQQSTLNGNFASKVEYEYSEDYTILTTRTTSAIYESEQSRVIRAFDEKGQIIKAETYDGDRHISTTEYTYNDDGEKILIRSTQPESEILITIQRIFDERGNLVTYVQDTGYYVARYEYGYNQMDQRIREEYYRDDVLLDYVEFTWEGNVGTGTSYKADGTPTGKRLLEYDDHGNLLRLESRKLSGETLTVSCYEYVGTDGSISSGIPE